MTINELLTLMDREVETLTADNYHAAASIMRAAAAKLRMLARHVDQQSLPE